MITMFLVNTQKGSHRVVAPEGMFQYQAILAVTKALGLPVRFAGFLDQAEFDAMDAALIGQRTVYLEFAA